MDKYCTMHSLKQGQKFTFNNRMYMKLPDEVECYNRPANAVDIITGTVIYINTNRLVNLTTMTVE